MLFVIRKDTVTNEDGEKNIVFGMEVYEQIFCFKDIVDDEKLMQKLVDNCNRLQPSPIHFWDILVDVVEESAASVK